MRLDGKTALVTGATSNIGRAIAVAFGAEGAHVIVSGRDPGRGAAVVDEIETVGGRATFVATALDGSAAVSRQLASTATEAAGGRLDVLVNNAGIFPGGSTVDTDEATFDQVYAVNVKAPYFLTAALAPAMATRGDGAVINLGSWIARLGIPVGSLYSSTKGALETLTRAWAAEFGPAGVRVNAISPGVIVAPPSAANGNGNGNGADADAHAETARQAAVMMRGTPANMTGTPDAVAHAAVYLASDEARFVHGTVIDVDGGRVGVAVIAG
jgi:NAD(P)-dependent dehydrogenase (short-subunit alcohol dehydrogenase family)